MRTTHTRQNLERTLWVLLLAAAGMAVLLALAPAAGHDQLWFLLMAQRWMHGAELYGAEIFDSNTPAVVWLSAVPVWLGERTGVAIPAVAKLLVVLLEGLIAGFSWRILVRFGVVKGHLQALSLAFAFVVLFGVAPARDLGQRDQLAGALLLPYVLASAVEEGWFGWRLAAGALAAVGVCLKPQQALVPVVVELTLLARGFFAGLQQRRRLPSLTRRPEPGLLVIAGVAFLSAIARFAPLYFSAALPLVRSTYWAIGHLSLSQLLGESLQLHVLMALAVGLFVLGQRRRGSESAQRFAWMLLVAGLAATCAYYVQGTGWYYQQLPGIGFLGAAVALEVVVLVPMPVERWRATGGVPYAADALAVLTLALTMHFSRFPFRWDAFDEDRTFGITTPDPAFFTGLPEGTPVATLTTSVDDAIMPVVRYRLTWAQRTNNLWLLPAVLRSQSPSGWAVPEGRRLSNARVAELAAMERLWMAEDFSRWKPQMVLIARCQDASVHCQELEDRHDDLLAFFLADPGFAQIWTHYRWVRRSGPYDAYELAKPFDGPG